MCPFLNASVCHPTVEMSRLGHSILLAIYNPLGWPRTEGVRVPLHTGFTSSWTVTGACAPKLFQNADQLFSKYFA